MASLLRVENALLAAFLPGDAVTRSISGRYDTTALQTVGDHLSMPQ
jgi:hypothetical protein